MNNIPNVIQTGRYIHANKEMSTVQTAFLLSFLSVIWRRVFITAILYCSHKKYKVDSTHIMKSLKYNIFSPTGIGNQLKKVIVKAMTTEIIKSSDYVDNPDIARVIKIYPEAYSIALQGDEWKEAEFVSNYYKSVFNKDKYNVLNIIRESKNHVLKVNGSLPNKNNLGNNHKCKFCDLIDKYGEINVSSNHSKDIYMNVIIEGLLGIIN